MFSDDVQLVDGPKTNGTEVIDLVETPEKKSPDVENAKSLTPRRSSRNLNKSKSYTENEKDEPPQRQKKVSEGSDVEEVLPQDPLGKLGINYYLNFVHNWNLW